MSDLRCTCRGDCLAVVNAADLCRTRVPAGVELHETIEAAIDARLRRIAERLRVSADGPLVPEAEVYMRMVVAKAIEEELEER